jgi:hypothetical protein
MDDFRLIRLDDTPVLLSKLAPSISTIFLNNPGYQVYQYDRASGTIPNYQTYYLNNLTTDGKPTKATAGSWALEYDFRESYGYPALNPVTVTQLAGAIGTNATIRESYIRFYNASAAPSISPQSIGIYRCAIANVTPEGFEACYRASASPAGQPPVLPGKPAAGAVPSK